MNRTLTSRTAVTNQRVRVIFRDGSSVIGNLKGWGAQMLTIAPDYNLPTVGEAADRCHGWKRHSFGVGSFQSVECA